MQRKGHLIDDPTGSIVLACMPACILSHFCNTRVAQGKRTDLKRSHRISEYIISDCKTKLQRLRWLSLKLAFRQNIIRSSVILFINYGSTHFNCLVYRRSRVILIRHFRGKLASIVSHLLSFLLLGGRKLLLMTRVFLEKLWKISKLVADKPQIGFYSWSVHVHIRKRRTSVK